MRKLCSFEYYVYCTACIKCGFAGDRTEFKPYSLKDLAMYTILLTIKSPCNINQLPLPNDTKKDLVHLHKFGGEKMGYRYHTLE